MAATIITTEDLVTFKRELLIEIKKELIPEIERIVTGKQSGPLRKWLKSNEVRRLLLISPGTLQNMRINGTLPFTKIGGVIFYDYEDIQKMLQANKRNPHPLLRGQQTPGL